MSKPFRPWVCNLDGRRTEPVPLGLVLLVFVAVAACAAEPSAAPEPGSGSDSGLGGDAGPEDAGLRQGQPSGHEDDQRSVGAVPDAGPEEGGLGAADASDPVATDGSAPPPPPDEYDCVDFQAHGQSSSGDTTPFEVPQGESYACFYFRGPWDGPVQGARIDGFVDNQRVLHHMLLYSVSTPHEDGEIVSPCLGVHADGTLIPAFGLDKLPDDVGFEMQAGDDFSFLLEIHYISSEAGAADRSGLRVCTSRERLPRTASLTWLGTELIGLQPNSIGEATGFCNPGRVGLSGTEPIDVYALVPHMHTRGRRAEIIVHRADGTLETVFDEPFDYANPLDYPVQFSVGPGDVLETRCHFQNPEARAIGYDATLAGEMCYVFALAHPAGALDHPGWSLVGALNTCFW